MHGEYLLQLIQAYSHFSEYYVWDEIYIEMFRDRLKCKTQAYKVYTPAKLLPKWKLNEIEPDHFFTYYFSGESEITVKKLSGIVHELNAAGIVCKVRPHPRYSHYEYIKRCFTEDEIENPLVVSLQESFGKTKYVVGLSTTVLTEAYNEGKIVVIDDITNRSQFINLADRYSISLKRKHILLSELLGKLTSVENGEEDDFYKVHKKDHNT